MKDLDNYNPELEQIEAEQFTAKALFFVLSTFLVYYLGIKFNWLIAVGIVESLLGMVVIILSLLALFVVVYLSICLLGIILQPIGLWPQLKASN
jgi:uncharacterized membrane protein YfhO